MYGKHRAGRIKKNHPSVPDSSSVRKEQNISNMALVQDTFNDVSKNFEHALKQLKLNEDVPEVEQVYNKLLSIQELISNKIQSFTLFEIMARVNCPFCSQPEADKNNLIIHLEECQSLRNKKFKKPNHKPYAEFQILPNNFIKCNVCYNSVLKDMRQYFFHGKTESHILSFNKISQTKTFTKFLFCSSCKILVPNNVTQFECHINHEIHKDRSCSAVNTKDFLTQGFHCIYVKQQKFKCLLCSLYFPNQGFTNTLKHFEETSHLKKVNLESLVFYCELCSEKMSAMDVMVHFKLEKHLVKAKEKHDSCNEFELCFYCGLFCNSLMELALHMETKCDVINDIRKNNLELKKSKGGNLKNNSFEEENIERKNIKNFILVKENTDIPALYNYFKKFGSIKSLELFKKKNVLIEFEEKNSVENVLLRKNSFRINEETVEVEACEGFNFWEKLHDTNRESDEVSKGDESESSVGSASRSSSDNDIYSKMNFEIQDSHLKELFQRVSSHLLNKTLKLNPKIEEIIIQDCEKSLSSPGVCVVVGFLGCRLSVSDESIRIYHNFGFLQSKSDNDFNEKKVYLSDTYEYNVNLIKRCFKTIVQSSLWKSLECNFDFPFPVIRGVHRKTQKFCSITFKRSEKIFTDILRYYGENYEFVRSFCLFIRFWLSVHEVTVRNHEYVVMSLLIFFLINQEIVEPYPGINSLPSHPFLEKALNAAKNTPERMHKKENYDGQQLFLRFLLFLKEFDFHSHAICVPREYSLSRKILKETLPDLQTKRDSGLCIIDPLSCENLAALIKKDDLKQLLDIVTITLH